MPIETLSRFDVRDKVKLLSSPGLRGRIVEVRGAFGPGGAMLYRVRLISPAPRPIDLEIREDQLAPDEANEES